MYAISFYFTITDLRKILEYINILNSEFAKIFHIQHDGAAYTDIDELLKLRENIHNEIYHIPMMNGRWPSNTVKFWDDSFAVTILVSSLDFRQMETEFKKMETSKDTELFRWCVYNFCLEISKVLPIIAADFIEWDEPAEKWWTELLDPEAKKWIYFWYVRENNTLKYIQWEQPLF